MKHPTILSLFIVILFTACSPAVTPALTPVATAEPSPASQTPSPEMDIDFGPTLAPAFGSYEEWLADFEYDSNAPLNIQENGLEERKTFSIHDIQFDSPVNGKVSAYLFTPIGEGPFPAVLFVHWYGRPHNDRLEFFEEATLLAREGVVSLLVNDLFAGPDMIHARHWTGINAEEDRQIVIQQVIELRRSIDVLKAQPQVDPQRIGYVGHDFGGMFGAVLAGVDHRIKTYVFMTVTPNFTDWFLLLSGGASNSYHSLLLTVNPVAYIPHAAPASVFFQFAKNDSYVPTYAANLFFNAASEPKRIEWYQNDHTSDPHDLQYNAQATQDRHNWLVQELGIGK